MALRLVTQHRVPSERALYPLIRENITLEALIAQCMEANATMPVICANFRALCWHHHRLSSQAYNKDSFKVCSLIEGHSGSLGSASEELV